MLKSKGFIKKAFIVVLVGLSLTTALPKETFAASSYRLRLTYPFPGSMDSDGPETKVRGTTPFVNPDIATTATNYYLSPGAGSRDEATRQIRNVTTTGRRNFTYNSGYGGAGNVLYINGYPDRMEYRSYTATGTWSP